MALTATIRSPHYAGKMYPADPSDLTRALSELFATAPRKRFNRPPSVIVAPHSALTESGDITAASISHALGHQYDTVVVIGPAHLAHFPGVSLYDGDAYKTPLGEIAVDTELIKSMSELSPVVKRSQQGHGGGPAAEYTVETLLPYLQIAVGKFKLIPIVTGDLEIPSARALAEVLFSTFRKERPLIIVSSDFAHFHDTAETTVMDQRLRELLLKRDAEKLINLFQSRQVEACGMIGLIAAMIYLQRIGVDQCEEIAYKQSNVDATERIGHGALVFTSPPLKRDYSKPVDASLTEPKELLSGSETRDLTDALIDAIRARRMHRDPVYTAPRTDSELLNASHGIFASIASEKRIYGLAGSLRSQSSLLQNTVESAVAAFDQAIDAGLDIENSSEELSLSIFLPSELKRIKKAEHIESVGKGYLIKLDFSLAWILPVELQVSLGKTFTQQQAIERACLKAQLPRNSHTQPQAELYEFDAPRILNISLS